MCSKADDIYEGFGLPPVLMTGEARALPPNRATTQMVTTVYQSVVVFVFVFAPPLPSSDAPPPDCPCVPSMSCCLYRFLPSSHRCSLFSPIAVVVEPLFLYVSFVVLVRFLTRHGAGAPPPSAEDEEGDDEDNDDGDEESAPLAGEQPKKSYSRAFFLTLLDCV